MSEEQSPADKPYDPTPARLEEARRKGEIVRSNDLNTAVMYGGFLLAIYLFGAMLAGELGQLGMTLFDRSDEMSELFLSSGGRSLAGGLLLQSSLPVFILILFPGVLLLISLFGQRAILFTPSKLQPKLNRISPLSNAKNKFGANGLFEFAKAAAKLSVYCILLGIVLWARRDEIMGTLYGSGGQVMSQLALLVLNFMSAVLLVALTLAAIDYGWQWAQHHKKHRMSHQELTEETKRQEGDPQMKQQRRERGMSIAMNRMLADVPDSDVVLVNPTHYAVALKWERGSGGVPVCVAKGVDEIAARIREAASEAGVPIFRDPPTTRALHATIEIGEPIQPDHYRAVAAAIRFADKMRARMAERF